MVMKQIKQSFFSPPSPNKGIRSPIKRAFFAKNSFFLEDSPGSPKSTYNVEEELKKKFLNNFLIEENPLEACKQYLDILIKKKLGEAQIDKVNEKDFIKNLVDKMKSIQNDKTTFLEDEIQTYLDEENKYLSEIRKKNEKIILTSQKLKNRMKLQKIDKEMKFQKSTKKNFGSLNTFIDASEFLQEINPFKEKNNPQFTDLRISASLRKLKGKALKYFDSQINSFMKRLLEEQESENGNFFEKDQAKISQNKSIIEKNSQLKTEGIIPKNNDKKKSKKVDPKMNLSDESSEEDEVQNAIPLVPMQSKIDPKKSTAMEFYQDLERKKSMFKYLARNSLFLEKNYQNQPLLQLLKEFSNPNSLLKRKRIDDEEQRKIQFQQKLIRGLIKSDDQLTQFDFQAENKNFVDNDGFYENLLDHFSKEEYYGVKVKEKKDNNSQKNIKSLEKYVDKLTNHRDEEEDEGKTIQVIEKKYNEFRNKSNAVLRLVSKASKLILNKDTGKTKEILKEKKLNEIKENTKKRLSMFSGEIQNNKVMKKLSLFNNENNPASFHSDVPEIIKNKIQNARTSISKPLKNDNDLTVKKETSLTERTETTPRLEINKHNKISILTKNFEEDINRTVFSTPIANRKTISNINAIRNLPKNENYFNTEKERSTTNSKVDKTTIPPNSDENRTFLISHKRVNSDLLNKTNYKKTNGGICRETSKYIDNIINRAENLKTFYEGEKFYLEKMENETDLFYNEQKNKLNSNLESLSMTLEKCGTKLKFMKLKKPNLNRFKRKKIMEQLI